MRNVTNLRADVREGGRRDDGEADEENISLRVGEGTETIVVLLTCSFATVRDTDTQGMRFGQPTKRGGGEREREKRGACVSACAFGEGVSSERNERESENGLRVWFGTILRIRCFLV